MPIDPTMTVAVVDGEPPLPPEHTSPPPIQSGIPCEEDGSKRPDASFILPLRQHGTERHVPNNVAIFNGRYLSDHDTRRSTDNTTATTTTHTNGFDDDDDDLFEFFDLPKTPDSAENAANSLTLERATPPTAMPPLIATPDPTTYATALSPEPPPPSIDLDASAESISANTSPQYPTQRSTDNTTTTTTQTTTTTPPTDEDDNDDDFFAFFDLPATSVSAENTASTLTSRETTPHHTINYHDATTPTNPTTMPTNNDDDDHFFAFLNPPETSATAVNAVINLMLDRVPPQHHTIQNHYDATTTKTTNPTTTPTTDDDNDFFEILNTPETFASAVNAASTPTPIRATLLYHTTDETDDAITPTTTKQRTPTTKTSTTDEDDDYNFFAPFISPETFDSKADAASTSTLDGATPPHPTIDDNDDATTTVTTNTTMPTTPTIDDDDDEYDFFAPPVLPATFDSRVNNCTSRMSISDNQHANHQPSPTPTTNWIHDTFAPVFQAADRLAAAITNLSDNIIVALETLDPHHVTNLPTNMPTQTRQPNLDPPQTHHRHKKHTKHRHFLCPPLPIPNLHFRKRLPFPATARFPSLTTYHRYLASNFQPP